MNLVGGFAQGARVAEEPIEQFEAQLRLNLRPTYLVTQAALPQLVAAGGGSIVCVGTRAALQPFPGAAGYVTAKAGVIAFAQAVAVEYRDEGVRCNALLPSVIDTPGEPRRDAGRRLVAKWVAPGAAGGDDRVPLLRRRRRHERRRDPRLRPRLTPPAARRRRSASLELGARELMRSLK